MKHKYTILQSSLISSCGLFFASASALELTPQNQAELVVVGIVKKIDTDVNITLKADDSSSCEQSVKGVILHIQVEGSLVGQAPEDIAVVASEQSLNTLGFRTRESNGTVGLARNDLPFGLLSVGTGKGKPNKQLIGLHGVFEVHNPRPAGGFYLNRGDIVREKMHANHPETPVIRLAYCDGAQYSLDGIDNSFCSPIFPTPTSKYDKNLPSGLKLLDFLASDALGNTTSSIQSLVWLRNWNPDHYKATIAGRTWLDSYTDDTIKDWFSKRFAPSQLSLDQQKSIDFLCLRADWGDIDAYNQFKSKAMREGMASKHIGIPRQTDEELLVSLIGRCRNAEEMKSYFVVLGTREISLKYISVVAKKNLGKHRVSDIGILECLYQLTANEKLNPNDEKGLKTSLDEPIREAKRVLASVD